MSYLLLLLYAAAAVTYAVHFARRGQSAGRAATTLLLAAALVHTFSIAAQTVGNSDPMASEFSRAISMFVWLLALSYLYLEITTNERAMGVFILPIVFTLQTIPTFSSVVPRPDPVLQSNWFWVHMASLLFAYASFAIAGVLGFIYVLQFKEIKKKHLGYFYTRLPSLQILDAMNSRAVAIGLVFLTIGVVVGIVWTLQARPEHPGNSNLAAIGLGDPKVFISVLTWVMYFFAVLARRTMGWAGRRASWLSAAGFVIVLLNFLAVTYLLETSHTFK
ncbi:MAG TPA: cytochrome c biogenesis protein CcsA [Vicinamibacterales bacterium]|nr:cytochrome c biogenesis protein CcsA [Vicinamibacterales bacterium]